MMYATAMQALWTVVPLLASAVSAATPLGFEPAGDAGISAQMVSIPLSWRPVPRFRMLFQETPWPVLPAGRDPPANHSPTAAPCIACRASH